MQLFFNTPSVISYGVLRYPQWNYVREGLLRNLQSVQSFYNSRVMAVKSNHFIARLVNNINVSHNHDLERYYDIVDARSNAIAAVMRMTSSLQRGAIFNGVFYGQGCMEVIMVDSSSFNPIDAYKNWRTLEAVKVVMHPRSDLGLMLPNGKATGAETGLAVISVNIPLLAIQFRAFVAEQLAKGDDDSPQGVGHFVHRYVLPNMLPTQLDYTIFNRVCNIATGAPMGESTRAHPFTHMADLATQCDKVHIDLVGGFKGRSMDFKAVLATIPAVTKNTMEQVMVIPENASTRQVLWAEVLSRIDALTMTIQFAGEVSLSRNMSLINSFAREFKMYQQDKAIATHLPRDIYHDAFRKMQAISALAGKQLSM